MKNSTSQSSQLTQDYSRKIDDYLNTIQSDKHAVTSRVDDLTNTIKSDKSILHGKYDRLEDYQYSHNPYTSDIGKSILSNFKWQGKNASDNAVADSSAGNGGNIDSFAAANAARQQLAFDVAGHNAALNDHNSRVTGIQKTLQDLGYYNLGTYDATNRGIESIVNQNSAGYAAGGKALDNLLNSNLAQQQQGAADFNNFMQLLGWMGDQNQQVFNNDMSYTQQGFDNEQTALNNQMLRYAQEADITGYVPEGLRASSTSKSNPYIALVNDPSVDFAARIEARQSELAKTTDPTMKQAIYDDIRMLNEARDYKITNVDGYGNYANTLNKYLSPLQSTANIQLAREGFDVQKWLADTGYNHETTLAKMGYDSSMALQNGQLASTERMLDKQLASTLEQINTQIASAERINDAKLVNELEIVKKQIEAQMQINNANVGYNYYKTNTDKSLREREMEQARQTAAQKPIMSQAEATKAVESGIITDEVKSAFNYHYGTNAYEKYYEPAMKETQFGNFLDNAGFSASSVYDYVDDKLKNKAVDASELKNSIIKDSADYNISVEDAKKIYAGLYPEADYSWLDEYRNPITGGWLQGAGLSHIWGANAEKGIQKK